MAKYNNKHEEIPDKTPVEIPLGYEKPEPLESMIARMVRVHSMEAVRQGLESFEEADDFNVDEEEVPLSTYQQTQMQEEVPIERPKPKGKTPVGERRKQPPPAAPEGAGDEKEDDAEPPAPVVKAPAPKKK